ncbi:hypothetical protein [Streptomyces aureus]|uniref:hypothetical protein n=1 Tax=Streptomyces aureus TaxID=193461 RepID=UPI003693913A
MALQTARDQVVQAAGIVPDEHGRLGLIGRRVLDRLIAPRRRTSTRKVKSPRRDDGRPDRSRTITDLAVTVLDPGPEQPSLPTASRDDHYIVPAQRRRHRVLALLQDDPTRLWRPSEIAAHFGDITLNTMYRQLSRWSDTGLIYKLGPGLYAATAWTSTPCHQHKQANFPALGQGPIKTARRVRRVRRWPQ